MSQIKKLDSTLAARIAAGEVIERPQSIVRELMDNAIDAGADEITLSIRGGGIDEIRLSDNGKGIMKEDLPLAVMQYATSKIEKLDDLYHLGTMGFRGEALHSICAVARLSVSSSWNSERPWTLVVDNMKAEPLVPAGPDRGTVVTVENLFSMIPARRNFLKRPQSEGTLCRNTFLAKAMAFENIQFTFYQDGAMKISLPKRRTVFDRVMDILTLDEHFQASDFTYLEKQCPDFSIRLVTSLPSVRRSDRSKIKIYVNKRPVDEFSLVQAVAFGYGEMLPDGQTIELESEPARAETMEPEAAKRFLLALYAVHNGVYAMSQDIPGLVETSSNLASVKRKGEEIIVVTSQRSSILSSRKDVSQAVRAAFELGGGKCVTADGYPGWKPNPSSEILGVAVESYKRLFGTEPKVKAIHAGLECGLFLEKYPSLDMVSFGPTLRGVHSPDERMLIPSVEKFWKHLVDVLAHIPAKA